MAKTAFVTGGTGFIGINLIELLVNEGWDVWLVKEGLLAESR